jgi:hypothetical protein
MGRRGGAAATVSSPVDRAGEGREGTTERGGSGASAGGAERHAEVRPREEDGKARMGPTRHREKVRGEWRARGWAAVGPWWADSAGPARVSVFFFFFFFYIKV